MNDDILIACTFPPTRYSYCATRAVAEAKMPDAEAYAAYLEKRDGQPIRFEIMTEGEFDKAMRAYYLSRPLEEVTPERFDEMLNILNPIEWEHRDGVERFTISEAIDNYYHEQFAKRGERCFCRPVHVKDDKTWITGGEIDKHVTQQPGSHTMRVVAGREAGERGRV
jgi:hypothetical protein